MKTHFLCQKHRGRLFPSFQSLLELAPHHVISCLVLIHHRDGTCKLSLERGRGCLVRSFILGFKLHLHCRDTHLYGEDIHLLPEDEVPHGCESSCLTVEGCFVTGPYVCLAYCLGRMPSGVNPGREGERAGRVRVADWHLSATGVAGNPSTLSEAASAPVVCGRPRSFGRLPANRLFLCSSFL